LRWVSAESCRICVDHYNSWQFIATFHFSERAAQIVGVVHLHHAFACNHFAIGNDEFAFTINRLSFPADFSATFPGDSASNCFTKSIQLIESLSTLGFTVRGRLADMSWRDTLLPAELICLWPADTLTTHFFVEIETKGRWRTLDPSWDAALEPAGFAIADWDGSNSPGFPLLRVYDLEEQAKCFALFQDADFVAKYFDKTSEFLRATNIWFQQIRASFKSQR